MKQLLYLADPMCSWCWGFAPQMQKLQAAFGNRLSIVPIMGGLRTGPQAPMSDALKEAVKAHWAHVSSLTGQPFNPDFFARDGFVYDTEPACRAVVSVRALQPEISLMYFGMLQQAFYAEGRDITRTDELAACAGAIGLAPSVFESFFASEKAIPATQRDFQIKQRLGVTSLPTLVTGSDGEDPVVIADGYRDLAPLFPAIERWIGSA